MFSDDDLRDLFKKVQKHLDKKRLTHVIGVTYMCAALAMHYDSDVKQAMTAGLLHDCAKSLTDDEKLAFCEKKRLPVTSIEAEFPQLLHSKIGAYLAREKYGIKDEAILHAIEVHTTGCVNMSMLDLILYVADFIEPNRKQLDCMDEARRLAFMSLEGAAEFMMKRSIEFVTERHHPLDPHTVEAYEYLCEKNH